MDQGQRGQGLSRVVSGTGLLQRLQEVEDRVIDLPISFSHGGGEPIQREDSGGAGFQVGSGARIILKDLLAREPQLALPVGEAAEQKRRPENAARSVHQLAASYGSNHGPHGPVYLLLRLRMPLARGQRLVEGAGSEEAFRLERLPHRLRGQPGERRIG